MVEHRYTAIRRRTQISFIKTESKNLYYKRNFCETKWTKK